MPNARKAAKKSPVRKTAGRKPAAKKKPARAASRWSQRVTATSNAMDLEPSVFRKSTPHAIALSLKRSAEHSKRRKSSPFRSAMSMLVFYENRAGRNLPAADRRKLEVAKEELRKVFRREA